ncbi:MAG: protein-L-isoaspartate(D-aspartate) O-methyltransferase [Gammaproteobacteria bacterium]|nr:protein-L-isoaspartate(D-aspartate) O-methyltransferase [Gammaproteobacteria bacterium]
MMDSRISGIGMTSARTRERLVQRLMEQGVKLPAVLERIRNVPRHLFVDEALASRAYEDTALPIGFGQTISQPYIVARMTEALLDGGPCENVLEVGTGCGYQTAVLSSLVLKLYTIERIEPLFARAKSRLKELGIKNVKFRYGDGFEGWKSHAPYDGILVAAAPMTVPDALLKQLAVAGRLVMPVGGEGKQELLRITRREQGYEKEKLGVVSFVPLQAGVIAAT